MEHTLVLIKPDGVKRNLIGEIIRRYEKAGLKVLKMKMLLATPDIVNRHYPDDEEYVRSLGQKSVNAGDAVDDVLEQGKLVLSWLREFISSGPLVAMILEGDDAVAKVRQITGFTDPSVAEKGTIRGDLGIDTILKANKEHRPVYNLIHASGNLDEAEKEIKLWFPKNE